MSEPDQGVGEKITVPLKCFTDLTAMARRHINWQPIAEDDWPGDVGDGSWPGKNKMLYAKFTGGECEWAMDWETYLDYGEYQNSKPTHCAILEVPSDDL